MDLSCNIWVHCSTLVVPNHLNEGANVSATWWHETDRLQGIDQSMDKSKLIKYFYVAARCQHISTLHLSVFICKVDVGVQSFKVCIQGEFLCNSFILLLHLIQ